MRIALYTICLGIGIVLERKVMIPYDLLLLGGVCCGVVFLFSERRSVLQAMSLCFVLGVGYIGAQTFISGTEVKDMGRYNVQARVCSTPLPQDTYYQVDLCISHHKKKNQWIRSNQVVRAMFFTVQVPAKGDVVRAKITFKLSEMAQKAIGKVSKDDDWAWIKRQVTSANVTKSRAQNLLPVEVFQIYQAIALGQSGVLSRSSKKKFVDLGIIHLFVFSGFHVGVLFSVFYFGCGLAFVGVKNMITRKKLQLCMAWLCTTVFLYMSISFGIPPVRAWIFLTLYVFHQLVSLRRDFVFIACVTFLIVMLLFPVEAFSLSSCLSFAAVVGIVWSLHLCKNNVLNSRYKKFTINFLVCMGAYLWTLPVLVYFFLQWNVLAYVYNFFLVPTFGIALIVCSIIFHLSLFLPVAFLHRALASVEVYITESFLWVVERIAEHKIGLIYVSNMRGWVVFAAYASLIITYLYLENQNKKTKSHRI